MARVPARCRRLTWPGAAILLMGVLVRPAAAQTTYNVATVAELQAALATVDAGPGGDLIVLAPGLYPLTSRLVVRVNLAIVGDPSAPSVIDGGDATTILEIDRGNVSIFNLTLQHGLLAAGNFGRGTFWAEGVTISDSVSGYMAGDSGGAGYFVNSTITGNSGGGLFTQCAELHLRNVTVSNNLVGIEYDFPCGEDMEIVNSLVVANGNDCAGGGGFQRIGLASLDSDGTCVALGFGPGVATASPSAIGLGALAANGGPTTTEAIPGTSAAVNAAAQAACPATDQRGYLRQDGACDIGAYESGASPGGGNTPPGGNVTQSPAAGVSVTFPQVTAQGNTTATILSTGAPPPPDGFQVDGVVYDIATTALFLGSVTVCLPYDPATNPSPSLMHGEDLPPLTWIDVTTSVDAVLHQVCGLVDSLSPFAVMRAAASGAGDVGDTLTIAPAGGGDITLSWSASCAAGDTDYAVYEGTLGGGYNHVARLCSTGGATSVTLTPQVGDAYYLIVPRNASFEGYYGMTSGGVVIPQGVGACAAQVVATVCP